MQLHISPRRPLVHQVPFWCLLLREPKLKTIWYQEWLEKIEVWGLAHLVMSWQEGRLLDRNVENR